ncbi:unnamed protein product [Prunus armeniaca]
MDEDGPFSVVGTVGAVGPATPYLELGILGFGVGVEECPEYPVYLRCGRKKNSASNARQDASSKICERSQQTSCFISSRRPWIKQDNDVGFFTKPYTYLVFNKTSGEFSNGQTSL